MHTAVPRRTPCTPCLGLVCGQPSEKADAGDAVDGIDQQLREAADIVRGGGASDHRFRESEGWRREALRRFLSGLDPVGPTPSERPQDVRGIAGNRLVRRSLPIDAAVFMQTSSVRYQSEMRDGVRDEHAREATMFGNRAPCRRSARQYRPVCTSWQHERQVTLANTPYSEMQRAAASVTASRSRRRGGLGQ